MTGDDSERGERDRASALDIKLNRRLDLFKRQLIAVIGPERQSRLRASVKFHSDGDASSNNSNMNSHKSPLARRLAAANVVAGLRARSLEVPRATGSASGCAGGAEGGRMERDNQSGANISPTMMTAGSRRSSFRCAILSPKRVARQRADSPRHLIRMLAERRDEEPATPTETAATEPGGTIQVCKSRGSAVEPPPTQLSASSNADESRPLILTSGASEATNHNGCEPEEDDTKSASGEPDGHESNDSDESKTISKAAIATATSPHSLGQSLQAPHGGSHPATASASSRNQAAPEPTSNSSQRSRGKLYMSQEERLAAACRSKECQELRELLAAFEREQDCPSLNCEVTITTTAAATAVAATASANERSYDPAEASLIQRRIETQFGQRLVEASRNTTADAHYTARVAELLFARQDAILELVSTEINYINRLKLVRDLFLGTLEKVQTRSSLLRDIHGQQLASNIELILHTHLVLWTHHLRPMAIKMVSCGPSDTRRVSLSDFADPVHLIEAFLRINETFKPYYRFCIEQASCIGYIRRLTEANECFRLFLNWCEQQRDCQRMRLADLLACPMQRLTRYPLLLRTMQKHTNDLIRLGSQRDEYYRDLSKLREQRDALGQMILLTERFVQTVNLEMKRRDEFIKLIQLSDCLSLEPSNLNHQWDFYNNQEAQNLLRSYARNFNSLMVPLFECAFSCQRQVLFNSAPYLTNQGTAISGNRDFSIGSSRETNINYNELNHFTSNFGGIQLGPIKFRDAQSASKLEATILVLTDQLLVCRHERQIKSTRSADHSPKSQRNSNVSSQRSNFYVYSLDNCRSSTSNLTDAKHQRQTKHTHLTATTSDSCNSDSHVLYRSSLDRSERLPTRTDSGGDEPPDDGRGARFERRRAASHSFERPPQTGCSTSSGVGLTAPGPVSDRASRPHELPPLLGNSSGNLNLLSPTRALVRLSIEQSLSSAVGQQQQQRLPSNQHQPTQSSVCLDKSTSNCSLNSTNPYPGDESLSQTRTENGPTTQTSSPGSRQQSFQRQSMSFSGDDLYNQHSATTVRDRDQTGGLPTAPRKLSAIRSPYPIERLTMHELSDGRSVLFCQLNDTRTIANSFVVYFSKNSQRSQQKGGGASAGSNQSIATEDEAAKRSRNAASQGSTKANKQQQQQQQLQQQQGLSQAKLLMDSVREAQVRLRTLARLHEQPLACFTSSSLDLNNHSTSASILEQNFSSSFESGTPVNQHGNLASCAQQENRSQVGTTADNQRQLEWIAEQHQMFMLSHGKHDDLATNKFTYELSQERLFEVTASPLVTSERNSNLSPGSGKITSGNNNDTNWRSNRPQLGRSMRISQESRPNAAGSAVGPAGAAYSDNIFSTSRSINSSPSQESELSNQMSVQHQFSGERGYAPDRSLDSERDAKSICSNSNSLISESKQPLLRSSLATMNQDSVSQTSRRNLSSLRRQNVVLSVSSEQQNLLPTIANCNSTNKSSPSPSPTNKSLQTISALTNAADQKNLDSSSLDSVVFTSLQTDDAPRRSYRNFMGTTSQCETSSIQTTTIDQTLDDTLWEQEDELARGLYPAMSQEGAPKTKTLWNNSRLQSIRSVSTEQTSSPIAITLAVPRRDEVVTSDDPAVADATDPSEDLVSNQELETTSNNVNLEEAPQERPLLTGCLDMRAFRFRERHLQASDMGYTLPLSLLGNSDKRHCKGAKSRFTTILEHLHLR